MSPQSFPPEIVELIATYLTSAQQHKFLTVSRAWYESVHRALYRVIFIKNRHQFRLLLQSLSARPKIGLSVRQVYLNKSSKVVGITAKELDQLATYCPYLEILDFDQKIWKYIKLPPHFHQQHHLRKLPAFNSDTDIWSNAFDFSRLTQLTLCGELVCQLFDQQTLIRLLSSMPRLQQLCLNSKQTKSHAIHVSLSDIEAMHAAVPNLHSLELSGSFKFGMDYTTQLDTIEMLRALPQTSVKSLKLKATIPPQWMYYIAHKYPQLQELDMEILDSNRTVYQSYKKRIEYPHQRIPSTEEIQYLFGYLLDCCPRLRRIELDSDTGKRYLTQNFFKRIGAHKSMKEIKMKSSTYSLVSRDQFFDLLTAHGQDLITGLGTEVIGTDLHISNILNPLSQFTKLTELILCCGHPYYDCEIDLILNQCSKLQDLTIRSAYVKLQNEDGYIVKQHPLKSLHLSTVSFYTRVFDYLGQTCHEMNKLSFYECDQKDSQGNLIEISMPYNDFDAVLMNGIRLDSVPLQCHTWIPNARILSIETDHKRWYHAYNGNLCYPENPKIQRLNGRKSAIAEHYYQYGWINNQKYLERAISRKQQQRQHNYLYSRTSKEWEEDLHFGCIAIKCRSIKKWELICNTTYHEF